MFLHTSEIPFPAGLGFFVPLQLIAATIPSVFRGICVGPQIVESLPWGGLSLGPSAFKGRLGRWVSSGGGFENHLSLPSVVQPTESMSGKGDQEPQSLQSPGHGGLEETGERLIDPSSSGWSTEDGQRER